MSTCILTTGAPKRLGFISTRFHGTDGVTLEARKWARILEGMDHSCFWMAGLLDAAPEVSHAAPLAFFNHPEVADVQSKLFGVAFRTRAVTNQIQSLRNGSRTTCTASSRSSSSRFWCRKTSWPSRCTSRWGWR